MKRRQVKSSTDFGPKCFGPPHSDIQHITFKMFYKSGTSDTPGSGASGRGNISDTASCGTDGSCHTCASSGTGAFKLVEVSSRHCLVETWLSQQFTLVSPLENCSPRNCRPHRELGSRLFNVKGRDGQHWCQNPNNAIILFFLLEVGLSRF